MTLVPVSCRALSWAITESGYSKADLDNCLNVSHGTVDRWIDGDAQPSQTQFNALKLQLKRPASVFFMNTPPTNEESSVAMRFAFGVASRDRSPEERLAIRDSTRVRNFVGDLQNELGLHRKELTTGSTNENPEIVANQVRTEHFGVSIEEQMSWSTPAKAFRQWR